MQTMQVVCHHAPQLRLHAVMLPARRRLRLWLHSTGSPELLRRCGRFSGARCFHELPGLEKRAELGEYVDLAEVEQSLSIRCAAVAQDPAAQPGPADEWLAAAQSASRLIERSGRQPDYRLSHALHAVLLRGGATDKSVDMLQRALDAGSIDEEGVRNITTHSLKHLVAATAADGTSAAASSEDGHWDLLRALQSRGLACQRHHTLVLHGCTSREEVHRVLRGMKQCGIVRHKSIHAKSARLPRLFCRGYSGLFPVSSSARRGSGIRQHGLLGVTHSVDVVG